jgi:hypothetical protein
VQVYPGSIVQVLEHPSPLKWFPSSHYFPLLTKPFPQYPTQTLGPIVLPQQQDHPGVTPMQFAVQPALA